MYVCVIHLYLCWTCFVVDVREEGMEGSGDVRVCVCVCVFVCSGGLWGVESPSNSESRV